MDYLLKAINYIDWDVIYKLITGIASVIQAVAAGIAIFLFVYKREKISSVFRLLIKYSFQTTLFELYTKIEKLNDYNATDLYQKHDVLCVLNEVEGQIRGNDVLANKCSKILRKISGYTNHPETLTEPRKRNLISELRETLRNIDLQSYEELSKR